MNLKIYKQYSKEEDRWEFLAVNHDTNKYFATFSKKELSEEESFEYLINWVNKLIEINNET